MVYGTEEWLPPDGKSRVQQWGWEEASHEGLEAHHGSLRDGCHDLHVVQAEETTLGKQMLVLETKQSAVLVQLTASGL